MAETLRPRRPRSRDGIAAPRPPTARKPTRQRRRDIAAAALEIIARDGLAGFTAVAIAERVGVSDAGLFRHFASKDEIVVAVIDRVEELLFPGPPTVEGPPLERLGHFFRHRAATLAAHPGVARLLLSELIEQVAPPAGVRRVREFKRRSVRYVRACLTEAHRAGHLAPGLAPDTATVVIVGTLMALTQARSLLDAGRRSDQAAAVWRSLEPCLRGAGAAAPVSQRQEVAP